MNSFRLFDGEFAQAIERCSALMADAIIGAHANDGSNFFAQPLFSSEEDLAYLGGSRAILTMRMGPIRSRQFIRQFKKALAARGVPNIEIDIHVAQFWAYHWSTVICQTNGADRDFARRKVKRYRKTAEQLTERMSNTVISS
jgi:hypothetical protein